MPLQSDFIRSTMLPHYPALAQSNYAPSFAVLSSEPDQHEESSPEDRKRLASPDDPYHPALKPKQRRISQACVACGRKKVKVRAFLFAVLAPMGPVRSPPRPTQSDFRFLLVQR
jgi:hypothetical protein